MMSLRPVGPFFQLPDINHVSNQIKCLTRQGAQKTQGVSGIGYGKAGVYIGNKNGPISWNRFGYRLVRGQAAKSRHWFPHSRSPHCD